MIIESIKDRKIAMSRKTCAECRWHISDKQDGDFAYIGYYCACKDSEHHTDYTDGSHTCDAFTSVVKIGEW